jgi:hypothetical protein
MIDDLFFKPAPSPSFVDHERHKKHESTSDANHLPLPFGTTIWPHTPEVIHCEQRNFLRLVKISGD